MPSNTMATSKASRPSVPSCEATTEPSQTCREREDRHRGQPPVETERGVADGTVLEGDEPQAEVTTTDRGHHQSDESEHHRAVDEERVVTRGVDAEEARPTHVETPALEDRDLVAVESHVREGDSDDGRELRQGENPVVEHHREGGRRQRQVQTRQPDHRQREDSTTRRCDQDGPNDHDRIAAASKMGDDHGADSGERKRTHREPATVTDERNQ